MELNKTTLVTIGTWVCVLLLLAIAVMIAYYPAGQAYARCEKNEPLLTQYEKCTNTPEHYPSFQCVSSKSDLGFNQTWTVTT